MLTNGHAEVPDDELLRRAQKLIARHRAQIKLKAMNHEIRPDPYEPLVRLAQNGDEAAYERLVARHRDKIYSRAFSMMRAKNDAIEFSEMAWVLGWQRIAQFNGESSFITWMTRIVINLCLDELRKRKRSQEEPPQPPQPPPRWMP
jgi:hypothetical protein